MAGTVTTARDPQDSAGLSQALEAFLRGGTPEDPYVATALGRYRALALQRQPAVPDGAAPPAELLLLAGDDGTVYVPADLVAAEEAAPVSVHHSLREALKRQRLRPTATALAVRLPGTAAGGTPRLGRFILWASPAYLAAGGEGGTVWK